MVERAGFEPAKPVRTTVLQTVPISHSGTSPASHKSTSETDKQPERGVEPANLPITSRLRCHCATRAQNTRTFLMSTNLCIIKVIYGKSQEW